MNKVAHLALQAVFIGLMFTASGLAQGIPGVHPDHMTNKMEKVARLLQSYRRTHDHLPQQTHEQDELLTMLYKLSGDYNPNLPLPLPGSSASFRTLGAFQIAYDTAIDQDSSFLSWSRNPPPNWSGVPGMIGIVTDGQDKFVLWAASDDGKPMVNSRGETVIHRYDCNKSLEAEDVRL